MSAHTPGPWAVERGWNDPLQRTISAALSLTSVRWERGVIAHTDGTPFLEQRDANAALIAAAPDMLAALKECLTALDRIRKAKLVPFHVCDVGYGADRVRSAIARAEGR